MGFLGGLPRIKNTHTRVSFVVADASRLIGNDKTPRTRVYLSINHSPPLCQLYILTDKTIFTTAGFHNLLLLLLRPDITVMVDWA